jgi:hypothetical protein
VGPAASGCCQWQGETEWGLGGTRGHDKSILLPQRQGAHRNRVDNRDGGLKKGIISVGLDKRSLELSEGLVSRMVMR